MFFCSQVVKSLASSFQTSRRGTLRSLLIAIAFHTPTVCQSANQFAESGALLTSVGGSLAPSRTDGQVSTDVGRDVTLMALVSLLSETMPDIDTLLALSPSDFEKLVANVLRSMGYDTEVSGKPGDGGVDVRLMRGTNFLLPSVRGTSARLASPRYVTFTERCSTRVRFAATS